MWLSPHGPQSTSFARDVRFGSHKRSCPPACRISALRESGPLAGLDTSGSLASKNRTGCEPSREKSKEPRPNPAIAAVLLVRFSLRKCPFGAENAQFRGAFSESTRNIRLVGGQVVIRTSDTVLTAARFGCTSISQNHDLAWMPIDANIARRSPARHHCPLPLRSTLFHRRKDDPVDHLARNKCLI